MPYESRHKSSAQEKENLKYGALTSALGVVALVGGLALPSHNREVGNLGVSLETAGLVVLVKGVIETLDAIEEPENTEDSDTDRDL